MLGGSAIVRGSTSGAGLGIAEGFPRAGMNVMLNGTRAAERIEQDRARLRSHGVKVLYSAANMMMPEEIHAMADEAAREFGTVDIIVSNSGIQYVAPIDEFTNSNWEAILAINLSSAFQPTKAVLPGMKEDEVVRDVSLAATAVG